jgi:nucleotide-binding universal stress UspA family protein
MHAEAPATTGSHANRAHAVFGRVLVGIDGTPESLVAAAQGRVLRAPDGHLELLAVAERHLAAQAGFAAALADDALVAGTAAELAQAAELVDADHTRMTSGNLVELLCHECSRRGVTLIAIGARPHRRLSAMTFGGHDVEALHDARCSLLIARPGWGPHKPDRIVVGVDGSPEAHVAEVAARSLGARLGCDVVPVVSLVGEVDAGVLREEREDALLDPRPLVDAVVGASREGSLIAVGREHRRGRRWRGTLVERIVYSARCSVLVVQIEPSAPA